MGGGGRRRVSRNLTPAFAPEYRNISICYQTRARGVKRALAFERPGGDGERLQLCRAMDGGRDKSAFQKNVNRRIQTGK